VSIVSRERSAKSESLLVLYDLQLGAKINLVAGCIGRGEKERRREEIC
jgi:hypothetical protein